MDPERWPVIILAGGKSSRLGRDKASEVLEGRTLLQRAIDATAPIASSYVVVTARDQSLPVLVTERPVQTVADAYPETGPLGGIYTGLAATDDKVSTPAGSGGGRRDELRIVVACDMPLLQPSLLAALARLAGGHDAVVPVRNGLPEPLCAVYSTACREPARWLLERGAFKTSGLLDEVDARLVPESEWRPFDPEALSFLNVNREEDLETARRLLSRT